MALNRAPVCVKPARSSVSSHEASGGFRNALVELFEGAEALRKPGLVCSHRFDLAGREAAVGTQVQQPVPADVHQDDQRGPPARVPRHDIDHPGHRVGRFGMQVSGLFE